MSNPKSQSILTIQALRGIAASMVVIHHAAALWTIDFVGSQNVRGWHNGNAGVDLFFVISGFVMALTSPIDRPPTATRFLTRRLIRIVPLYWFVTCLATLKASLVRLKPNLGSGTSHILMSPSFFAASLFFIPYRNSENLIQPIVPAGWTLSYEMFFYLLFSMALLLRIKPHFFLTPVLLLLACLGLFRRDTWPSITVVFDPLLIEFLGGVLLGYTFRAPSRISRRLSAFLGVVSAVALLTVPTGRFAGDRLLFWGVPAFFIVRAAVVLEDRIGPRIPRLLLDIGDSSYSLYLIHALVLLFVDRILLRAHVRNPPEAAVILVSLVASIVTGLLLFRFMEAPTTRALVRRFHAGIPRFNATRVKNLGALR